MKSVVRVHLSLLGGNNMEIKKVNLIKEPADYEKYEYAVCKCTRIEEAIRIVKPKYSCFLQFKCPCCGESLGLFIRV